MTIKLSAWQSRVLDDTHRYIVINCGRRAGKSFLVAAKIVHFASERPNRTVWYVAPDYKQAKQIMWEMLKEIMPQQAVEKTNSTELSINLKNGSRIMLKGAQEPDSLRGVKIDFCVFDECAFFTQWEEAWKVLRPTLIDSKAHCWFISTPNGFNHFKELAEKDDPDYVYYHYTSYDNPFIDKEELDKVKEEMDEDSFAQEILGDFRQMKGLVYKNFHRETHMVDIPKDLSGFTFYRSIDFGFKHKTALGYFAVSPDLTAIYMYDGLYKERMDTDTLANIVKMKDGSRFITGAWADSAQPQLIEDLNIKEVSFTPVTKGADSVVKGIANVAELLKIRADTGKPTLMFNKECDWVAYEAERYRWVESKNEESADRQMPLKREDDAMDMIRYFCMSYMQPVEDDEDYTSGNVSKLWGGV